MADFGHAFDGCAVGGTLEAGDFELEAEEEEANRAGLDPILPGGFVVGDAS